MKYPDYIWFLKYLREIRQISDNTKFTHISVNMHKIREIMLLKLTIVCLTNGDKEN